MSSPIAARTDPVAPVVPRKRLLHRLFEASLLIKGLFAGLELLAGLAFFATPGSTIIAFLDWLTAPELARDPRDPLRPLPVAASFRPFISEVP